MLHDPANREGPGKQIRGGLRLACLEEIANPAGGDDRVAVAHRRYGARFQPMLRAMLLQQCGIALRALAESEILARQHAMRTEPLDENALDEILGTGARQFGVEVEHQHRGRPEGEIEFVPLLEAGQAEGRGVRPEELHRVRIEGRDDHRALLLARPADRLARDRLMPLVKPVEIAERDDGTAQGRRHLFAMVEPPHCGTIPARSTRRALPPITARISSSVKPSSISACVTCIS